MIKCRYCDEISFLTMEVGEKIYADGIHVSTVQVQTHFCSDCVKVAMEQYVWYKLGDAPNTP